MSAIKRIQTHLTQVEKRALQSATANLKNESSKSGSRKRKFGQEEGEAAAGVEEIAKRIVDEREEGGEGQGQGWREEVVVKATGKAIQKALAVAVWFQDKEGFGVLVRTGSVVAIDDVEVAEDEEEQGNDAAAAAAAAAAKGSAEEKEDQSMIDVQEEEKEKDIPKKQERGEEEKPVREEDVPETRIRHVSTIEIAVYKK